MLDAAASSLGVVNVNNVADEGDEKGEGRKLRVYHVEGGRMLGFSERFGDAVGNGNEVVLLRGVKMSS